MNVIRPSVVPYDEEQDQFPEHFLSLEHVHGFSGHAVESRQNLLLCHDEKELLYPMAATAVLLDADSQRQRHWLEGKEPISSLCIHPVAPIVVTGHVQRGPDRAKLRVWNYRTLTLHKVLKRFHEAAVLCSQWSSVSGLLYTVGAQGFNKMSITRHDVAFGVLLH